MSKFQLEILTPEKIFFDGEVDSLTVETEEGELCIWAHHAPLAVGLPAGVLRIRTEENVREAVNGEGFVEVRPDKTVVLCQTMEWPEEIEKHLVERAIYENERRMREARSRAEYQTGKANLARAFARLRLTK